jgi:hypothetical protein
VQSGFVVMQPNDTVDQLEGCVRLAFVVSFIYLFIFFFFVTKRHMTDLEHTLLITDDDSKPH